MKEAPQYPANPVLIIDDELHITQGTSIALKTGGITNIIQLNDSRDAMSLIKSMAPSVILLDLNMPHVSGQEIFAMVSCDFHDIPVIIATGNDELETAVRCMKAGAFDYMVKPVTKERLISTVKRALELRELRRENQELKLHVLSSELKHKDAFAAFDTRNEKMLSLFRYVESIAPSSEPVLITGETGVGKEIMARCIHRVCCPDHPFIPVNLAGLDETSFSDTLFGHRKGAFTGAGDMREGLISKAENGIVFFDEIGDLDIAMQVKLLRLLQEREYLPLGSDMPRHSTSRFIVATNKTLDELREKGKFREDLYFRLRHHHVHIPPLRERLDDLPSLVNALVEKTSVNMNKQRPLVTRELIDLLETHDFPGNIRELEAMIHDAMSQHSSGALSLKVFKGWIGEDRSRAARTAPATAKSADGKTTLPSQSGIPVTADGKLPTLKEAQEQLIEAALKKAGGNQTVAAKLLGITRQALNQRLGRMEK